MGYEYLKISLFFHPLSNTSSPSQLSVVNCLRFGTRWVCLGVLKPGAVSAANCTLLWLLSPPEKVKGESLNKCFFLSLHNPQRQYGSLLASSPRFFTLVLPSGTVYNRHTAQASKFYKHICFHNKPLCFTLKQHLNPALAFLDQIHHRDNDAKSRNDIVPFIICYHNLEKA